MEQIGRYQILGELGRGACGVVYRAQDPAIGRVIAIKTIRLSDFTDEAERGRLRERLFREAQSAGILSHPNIVTIYDIAEENDLAYIFMECVDGPALDRILDRPEAMDGALALSILRQTATALDYAHKKGIVHRDIKPANILVHESATAKITDFGVAKILSQQMTQSGVMMGTPNYMSPEQVQGHTLDGRADQFALAVIAYEMLTGEKPFVADQLPALLFRIVREDPVPPQRLNPTVGLRVEAVLKKGLSKNPADRYANCMEFVDALSAACLASPGWHPLPRRGVQSLPTVVGRPSEPKAPAPAPAPAPPLPASVPATPAPATPALTGSAWDGERRPSRETPNPVMKSLVWMLVGIGLVGLVLFGAQKYLFNRNTDSPSPVVAETPAQQPAGQASEATPAKPSPVGDPTVPEQAAKETPPPEPAESTTPEKTEPEKPPAPEPLQTRPAQQAAAAPSASRPGPQQSVQFITDPPGAAVTIDGNSSTACKAPCILMLGPGRHALTAQLAGYRPYPRVFTVPEDSDIFLQLAKASGTLSVTSNPSGATIEINGQMQAKRTPAVFEFAPGAYRVRVARNGASLDFDVQIHDGEFVNKRVDF